MFNKVESKEKILTAEEAYFKTKYGIYRTTEQRIRDNQRNIKELIKSKMSPAYRGETNFSSYYCVVDLDDDMKPYVDSVFKPFVDGGFEVINLAGKVKEIENEQVYLISWDKKFRTKKNNNND